MLITLFRYFRILGNVCAKVFHMNNVHIYYYFLNQHFLRVIIYLSSISCLLISFTSCNCSWSISCIWVSSTLYNYLSYIFLMSLTILSIMSSRDRLEFISPEESKNESFFFKLITILLLSLWDNYIRAIIFLCHWLTSTLCYNFYHSIWLFYTLCYYLSSLATICHTL